MPIPVWPPSLPQRPLVAGFRETRQNIVARSQTDIGPGKTRRRATDGVTNFDMQFRMTSAQLASFRTFFKTDLQAGALTYSWAHPVTGATGVFRFTEPPSIAPAGVSWVVAVNVEMLP